MYRTPSVEGTEPCNCRKIFSEACTLLTLLSVRLLYPHLVCHEYLQCLKPNLGFRIELLWASKAAEPNLS